MMDNIMKNIKTFLLGKSKQELPDDMFANDCLVGIVKDKIQLDANLKHCFYHIPSRFIYELDLPVKYIALYTSIKTFGKENAGILYYGKIKETKIVDRYKIKSIPRNSAEKYYVFIVEKWERLEKPIKPLEIINISTVTSIRLLKSSEFVAELYLKSWEEYWLFAFLKDICIRGVKRKTYNFKGTRIAAAEDKIEIIFADGDRRKFNREEYKNRPFLLFRKIMLHNK